MKLNNIQDFCELIQRNKISLILSDACIIIYFGKRFDILFNKLIVTK